MPHTSMSRFARRVLARTSLLQLAPWALIVACHDGSGPRVYRVGILPTNPVVLVPATVQLIATARDAAGSVVGGRVVIWSSDDSIIATVSESGILTGHRRGATAIRARVDGVEGGTAATVKMPTATITVLPTADTVVAYDTVTFTAVTTDVNGDTVMNPVITWSSGNDSLAAVDSQGVVITLGPGTVSIRASVGSATGTATLRITPPRVASVEIRAPNTGPPTTQIPLRATEQFIALTFDAKEKLLLGRVIDWQSSDSSVLSVGSVMSVGNGAEVAALAGGAATITASSEGIVSPGTRIAVLVLPPLNFLTVGDFGTCAIATDSTAYCWGANNYGELGDGTTTNRDGPVLVVGGHTWTALANGDFHTCGITGTGAAYCWGRNDQGQLGTGTTNDSHVPVAVTGGHPFQSIATGSAYTCGVTTTQEAYCWGSNGQGQLGTGSTTPSLTPALVQGGHSFESISTSRIDLSLVVVTCGVTATGEGYCWGTNSDGQLGTGDSASSAGPRRLSGTQQWTEISASTVHACGRDATGTAYCWGANPRGAFGNGTLTSDPRPTPVDSGPFTDVSAGYLFGCAVQSDADIVCFGTNESFQLGIDGPEYLDSPTNPAPGLRFVIARAGRSHACALTTGGRVYCWGSSAAGEAGADKLSSVRTPFKVVGQP